MGSPLALLMPPRPSLTAMTSIRATCSWIFERFVCTARTANPSLFHGPFPPQQAKLGTLKKYAEVFELNVRPDLVPGGAPRTRALGTQTLNPRPSAAEFAIAVARHFESHLEVDEDECLARFMNAVRGLLWRRDWAPLPTPPRLCDPAGPQDAAAAGARAARHEAHHCRAPRPRDGGHGAERGGPDPPPVRVPRIAPPCRSTRTRLSTPRSSSCST